MRVCLTAKGFGMVKSTLSTILKSKDPFKASDIVKGLTVFIKQRPQVLKEVQKLLFSFINELQSAGDSVSENEICSKAQQLYGDFITKYPRLVPEGFDFKASGGWFEKFRKRSGKFRQGCCGKV